jgi:putative inorganic carbon (hco3(-)) transporter
MDIMNRDQERLTPTFILFLFYVVVWWLQLGERLGDRFGTDIRLEAVIALFLLVIIFFDSFRKNPEEKTGLAPFVMALFAVMLLKVVFAWNVDRAWYVFTERVLKYAAFGFFASHFVRTPKQLRWFIFIWLLVCWKGTLEGVIGGITGSLVWENQGIPRLHGNGLWSHPNSFSQFAIGVIPFCFYLFPVVKRKWLKLGILTLFCFATYVVIFTGSRTGYLGYLIMIVLFFFQSSKQVRTVIVIMSLLMIPIFFTFMPQNYQERFMSSFTGQEKEGGSKQARLTLYKEGWFVFTHHPFGVGLGNYPEAGMKYFKYKQEQHCLYTEVLTEIGLQGFAVFMVFLWKIYSILQALKIKIISLLTIAETRDNFNLFLRNDIEFMYAVIRSTLVYFLLRLFLDIFGMDLYSITWWFVIGIISSIYFIIVNVHIAIVKD